MADQAVVQHAAQGRTVTAGTVVGRRERKRAATRSAISEAATRLFMARGYDQVSVKDVAEAADVSVTTLFQHFRGKEAMVFDEDADREAALVAAVRDRQPGQDALDALEAYLGSVRPMQPDPDPTVVAFRRMVKDTPALREHSRRVWLRRQSALALAIAETTDAGPLVAGALARFALDSFELADSEADSRQALRTCFELLRHGWTPHDQSRPSPR